MTESDATREFQRIWERVPNRTELEATHSFATVGTQNPRAKSPGDLPRVDHLLSLGDVLGVGGHGQVVAARQASLHRTIAVKQPLDDASLSHRLLREAQVIGLLEHPNIPPVHFVGCGPDQGLLVGLKRIEGETLTDRLSRQRPLENLDEDLGVLIQVCNAVGFAHSRGILHLDIKPDNVMTGHYGEVYVLDWGLAVAYQPGVADEMLAHETDSSVRGTPAFMPREMVVNDDLTPATDVYLLGGLLFYMLTHEAPNAGDSVVEAMQFAYEGGTRTYPDAVPEPLRLICERALALEPADRYRDADAFRTALAAFRTRRQEHDAFAAASVQIGQLLQAVGQKRTSAEQVYQRYGAARAAVEAVARLDPGRSRENALLEQVLEPVIRWELQRKNVGAAELLLTELTDPDPELVALCAEMRQRDSRAMAELEAFRADADPNVENPAKVIYTSLLGFVLAAIEVAAYLLEVPATAERVLGGYLLFMVIAGAMTFKARKRLMSNSLNRSLLYAIAQLVFFALALRIGAVLQVITLPAAIAYDLVLVVVIELFCGATLDRRLLAGLPFYVLGIALCFVFPDAILVVFGMTHFLALSAIALAIGAGGASRSARSS